MEHEANSNAKLSKSVPFVIRRPDCEPSAQRLLVPWRRGNDGALTTLQRQAACAERVESGERSGAHRQGSSAALRALLRRAARQDQPEGRRRSSGGRGSSDLDREA